tara:strand:+ start:5030 stop:5545 length:516 start_codon:yes stop_codon:yes gene_type:complete
MLFTFHEILGVGLFSSLIYGWNKFKNRDKNFNDYDNIMITYKLNKYFNKSLKGIEKDYRNEKISDDEFFVEDEGVMNYLLDLLNGYKFNIHSGFCRGHLIIHYEDREKFLEAIELSKWFMKQGHNNFKNYVFYIVCEDNTKETTIFMEGDNVDILLTNMTSDEIIMEEIFQ